MRYTRQTFDFLWKRYRSRSEGAARQKGPQQEIRVLLNALAHGSTADLSRAQCIFFSTRRSNDGFQEALAGAFAAPELPAWIRRTKILDLRGGFTRERSFLLDPHINARGHEWVAGSVLDAIGS
jgi:hypothetical protein